MRIIWAPSAQNERELVFQHVAFDNFEAAVRLDLSFDMSAESLLEFPQKGRVGRLPGTRELVVHPNYILVYRIMPDGIEIARLLHAAQRWP